MKIVAIILTILALANLGFAFLAVMNKIKPSKSTQIIHYLTLTAILFVYALMAFTR